MTDIAITRPAIKLKCTCMHFCLYVNGFVIPCFYIKHTFQVEAMMAAKPSFLFKIH